MTETITATEVLKSRQNFSDYIEQNADTVIKNLLKDYLASFLSAAPIPTKTIGQVVLSCKSLKVSTVCFSIK